MSYKLAHEIECLKFDMTMKLKKIKVCKQRTSMCIKIRKGNQMNSFLLHNIEWFYI